MGSVDGEWRISRVSVSGRLAFVRVDGKVADGGEGYPDLSGSMRSWRSTGWMRTMRGSSRVLLWLEDEVEGCDW